MLVTGRTIDRDSPRRGRASGYPARLREYAFD